MSEWICYVCSTENPCRFGCDEETGTPDKCPLAVNVPVWEEVIRNPRRKPEPARNPEQFGNSEQLPEKIKGFVEKAIEKTAKNLHDKIVKHPYAIPKQPVTDCNQLPKLTAEIFNHPNCPNWAEYAAVDSDGQVWAFGLEPFADEENRCFRIPADDYVGSVFIANGYDATDWQHSLIQRVRYTSDGVVHVRFKKLDPEAKAPYQATPGSAGFDLTAVSKTIDENMLFHYGTGLAVEIPAGHVGLVFPRSSIYKEQMTLTNCVGVIDSDYRGEIKAVFSGKGMGGYKTGDRIAQLVIVPIPAVKFEEAEELTETQRGAGGYGSTGR